MSRETPAPPAALSDPTVAPLTPEHAERLTRCLHAPSGQAVMVALAGNTTGAPMTARLIATTAYLSSTAARAQAYRAARLGYATQTVVATGVGPPATAWQITERGRDFLVELGAS